MSQGLTPPRAFSPWLAGALLTQQWWRANWQGLSGWMQQLEIDEIIAASGLLGANLGKATGSRSAARVAKSLMVAPRLYSSGRKRNLPS